MTAQDELARIDGATLAVKSTKVGKSPRVVATIPGSDGAVVLDSTTAPRRSCGRSGDTRHDARARHAAAPQSARHRSERPVRGDLVRSREGDRRRRHRRHRQLPGRHGGRARAGQRARGQPHRRVSPARGPVRRGGQSRVRDHAGRRLGDRPRVRDRRTRRASCRRFRSPIRASPPEDLEVDIVATGEYAAVRQAATSQRCASSTSARRPGVACDDPARVAGDRHRPRARTARASTRCSATAKQLAIVDIPADALDPSGVETVDLTNATLGSLVLSRDGTRGLLFTNATLDERITLVKLDQPGYPQRDVAAQEGGARGRHLADRRHRARPQRQGVRRSGAPRRTSTTSSTRATATRCSTSRPASASCRSRRSIRARSTTRPTAAKVYVALDGGDAVDRDARAAGRHDADRRRDRRSRSARRRRRSASCPARRRRSSRSAIRSAACRSSTSTPTRSAPSPASTSTATS